MCLGPVMVEAPKSTFAPRYFLHRYFFIFFRLVLERLLREQSQLDPGKGMAQKSLRLFLMATLTTTATNRRTNLMLTQAVIA